MNAHTQRQIELFFKKSGMAPGVKYFNILEREEKVRTGIDALEYLEQYTGPLAGDVPLIPVTVFYVPESNFFLLEVCGDEEN